MADWISVEEAAEMSGYNQEHIRRLIRWGLISAKKKGGQWWVDKGSLQVYVKESQKSEDSRRGPKSR